MIDGLTIAVGGEAQRPRDASRRGCVSSRVCQFSRTDMGRNRTVLASLIVLAALVSCTRVPEGSRSAGAAGGESSVVAQDVKGMAKAAEKTADDVGHATLDLGQNARKNLDDVAAKAGAGGEDAWITTKVKSELTRLGFDPLHVHVDTDGQVVTLSGAVESAAETRKAVAAAKAVKGVMGVHDRLFVKPAAR
jgi:hyperosmotically inducible periplasmic protein